MKINVKSYKVYILGIDSLKKNFTGEKSVGNFSTSSYLHNRMPYIARLWI